MENNNNKGSNKSTGPQNKQMKSNKRKLLIAVIPPVLLYFVLVYAVKLNEIATVFICFGVFSALLMLINHITAVKAKKEEIPLNALVLSSERKKEHINEYGKESLSDVYWLSVLQIFIDGAEKTVEIVSPYRLSENSYIKVYYNPKTEVAVTEELAAAREVSGKQPIAYVVMAVCFLIAACIIFIPKMGGFWSSRTFWMTVLGFVIGIVFMLFGIKIIADGRKQQRAKNNSLRVKAVLTDVIVNHSTDSDGGTDISYFPVYEYEYGGEIHTYKSSVSSSRYPKKGTQTHVYINPGSGEIKSGKGKVFEESEAKKNIKFGAVFAVIGVLELALMVFLSVTEQLPF